MKTNTKEMRVCLTPLFKMWLVRLLDGNIISFYPLWNMSDVSSFIESTWQQISLDDTWSHYQEHQDQTSREKLHARVVFPFGQTAGLRMKLTFHPRRSLLLSPNSNVWRKKKKKCKQTSVTTSAKQTCWTTSKKALELLMHMHKL